jgi:hypothetical protein
VSHFDPLDPLALFSTLRWLDGRPLLDTIEPYRRRIFEAASEKTAEGSARYNLILAGRAKKNWKSADLILSAFYALFDPSPGGQQCYLLANDEGQAADDLSLAKKLIAANPGLARKLVVKQRVIERKDGLGFIEILPARDVAGAHGKTYRFCGFDEIHAYKNWDIFEALALDPTRRDAQQWITSYASLYHKPGVPLFDLMATGWAGTDPRMAFSWYGADQTTDRDFVNVDPETRANPSRASWADPDYLDQQRRRLPVHKYRRLHLNLPGLPEGSAYQAEPVMDAVARGVTRRSPGARVTYRAFADMSAGSSDDAVLAIAHPDADGRAVLDVIVNQGPPPPFDPRRAVERFVTVLEEYGLHQVTDDKYAGETFVADFQRRGITYAVSDQTKSQLYEAFEPRLNAREVVLLDVPILAQQLLGLIWRGGKVDHPPGEHDDWANAAVGALSLVAAGTQLVPSVWIEPTRDTYHARQLSDLGTVSRHSTVAPMKLRALFRPRKEFAMTNEVVQGGDVNARLDRPTSHGERRRARHARALARMRRAASRRDGD